jgi:hypothetical protein
MIWLKKIDSLVMSAFLLGATVVITLVALLYISEDTSAAVMGEVHSVGSVYNLEAVGQKPPAPKKKEVPKASISVRKTTTAPRADMLRHRIPPSK